MHTLQTAWITGASRGIGAAVAKAFAQKGYAVVGTYCHSAQEMETLARDYAIYPLQVDLADTAALPKAAAQAQAMLGHIDVLVNNAACAYTNLFQCMSPAQVQQMYAVNLTAVVELSRLVLPDMLARHSGCIINISSMWGETGASCEVDYSVTKGAVLALTKALAKEVGPSGIRVNAVSPGTIDTAMNAHLSPADLAALADETPLGRLGTPEDVANTVLYLASEQAAYITGQDIGVNGGFLC